MSATTMRTPAVEARVVVRELPEDTRAQLRVRVMIRAEFGVHWLWRNGAEYYTAAGLRLLAEAYDAEHDEAAAVVCRRLAVEIDREVAQPVAESFAELASRRWDLRGEGDEA